ncbi:MAG: hypothetical protein K2L12_02155, partial [Clostridia bacterium]|nr:hypothetical protein [Clostridia bacterium]
VQLKIASRDFRIGTVAHLRERSTERNVKDFVLYSALFLFTEKITLNGVKHYALSKNKSLL